MTPKSYKKNNMDKKATICRTESARLTIGKIEKNTDTFCLTYGQFSLIDALIAILEQTGPAHVIISTWTAAHADLSRSSELMEAAEILSFKMIIDRSFKKRQPKYYENMISLFGSESIREINTHAKFLIIRNDKYDLVVRTSMNLNGNPRLENIEVSENKNFAEFFQKISDDIFSEFQPGTQNFIAPKLKSLKDNPSFQLVRANHIKLTKLKEASYSHVINTKS